MKARTEKVHVFMSNLLADSFFYLKPHLLLIGLTCFDLFYWDPVLETKFSMCLKTILHLWVATCEVSQNLTAIIWVF